MEYGLENIEPTDTIIETLPDSYKELNKKMGKTKFGKRLYQAIIKEPQNPANFPENISIEKEYASYKGKKIRNIEIVVLKPFGTDINHPDSTFNEDTFNESLNNLHFSTKHYVIRNNLQFKEGETVDPFVIAETEAFLRNAGYINDARINIIPVPSSDMVDITVIVRDVFAFGFNIHSLSGTSSDVEIFHRNLLGTGSRVEFQVIHKKKYDPQWGYGLGCAYQNLAGTFIDVEGSYLDNITNQKVYLSAERNLQSKIEYFGQISYLYNANKIDIAGWDSISPDFNNEFSVSFGKSIKIPDKHAVKRFVIAGRYQQKSPEYRNVLLLQSRLLPYSYVKKQIWLLQTSIYKQAYYRQHLIHNFGITEDIAHGYNISTQIGYSRFSDFKDGMYGSVSASFGNNYKTGNYFFAGSLSSFFDKDEAFEGILKLEGKYFSPLIKIGKNRFRQFANISYNRLMTPIRTFENVMYFSDISTLNTNHFRNEAKGTERFSMNLESDMFSAIKLAGFRFLFYGFLDSGWITSYEKELFNSQNFNYGLGVGIRIRNDLLVFKTIDIKLGIYPKFNQGNFTEYFNIKTTDPTVSPNFTPGYPEEISLN